MATDYKLNDCEDVESLDDWRDAKSFDDLCNLMQRSLTEDFDSFTSGTTEETGCVLVEESVKYQDDFLKLNELGFLTIDSQPGVIKYIKIDDDKNICCYAKQYNNINLIGWTDVYEQRDYIEGFMEKYKIQQILPKLSNYIVCIQPSHCTGEVEIFHDYLHKLESNQTYFFIPENFDETWPDSSCIMPHFDSAIRDNYYLVNLSRHTYNQTHQIHKIHKIVNYDADYMNLYTNLQFEKNSSNFDTNYHLKYFKQDLQDWMKENTYLVMIISPVYGTTTLSKYLIELLE